MKDEYLEETQDHHHHTNPNNMFSNIQQQQHTKTFHHQTQNHPQSAFHHPSSHDGATIELIRRPRGRPPGSKNKSKPPVIITREPEPSMSPYVLELSPNVDIVSTVLHFCQKRNINLCIFNGSGTVTNVTLHQPSSTQGATVTFHGCFDILSISATILPNNNNSTSWYANFTISLAGPQGEVFGGAVVGPLASAGTIYLIAGTFNNPVYQRLPLDDINEEKIDEAGGGGANEGKRHHSPPGVSGGGENHHQMGTYSCSLASDVIWAPIARQPPPC